MHPIMHLSYVVHLHLLLSLSGRPAASIICNHRWLAAAFGLRVRGHTTPVCICSSGGTASTHYHLTTTPPRTLTGMVIAAQHVRVRTRAVLHLQSINVFIFCRCVSRDKPSCTCVLHPPTPLQTIKLSVTVVCRPQDFL